MTLPVLNDTNFYYRTVKNDNPIMFYLFNEQTGTTVDDLSDNNINTFSNFGATIGNAVGVAGIKRSGFTDGTNDYFYNGSLNATYGAISPAGNWTIEFWFKPNNVGGSGTFPPVMWFGGANPENRVANVYFTGSNGYLNVDTGLSDGINLQTLTASTNYNDNAWHYVAITSASGGAEKLYVDNVEKASSSAARRSNTDNKLVLAGVDYFATAYGKQNITGLAAYNTTLSTTQMTNHYNAGLNL
jgi:hypothetical protein